MIVLGLDCATKTGWCLWDSCNGKVLESGVQDFSKKRGESNGIMFLRFRNWLEKMAGFLPKVELISYERAHHRGGAATEICVNLTGRVQEVADAREIPYMTVETGTLKKFACGKGNAGKDDMISAAKEILGRDPEDDNEADAVHIARWAAQEVDG